MGHLQLHTGIAQVRIPERILISPGRLFFYPFSWAQRRNVRISRSHFVARCISPSGLVWKIDAVASRFFSPLWFKTTSTFSQVHPWLRTSHLPSSCLTSNLQGPTRPCHSWAAGEGRRRRGWGGEVGGSPADSLPSERVLGGGCPLVLVAEQPWAHVAASVGRRSHFVLHHGPPEGQWGLFWVQTILCPQTLLGAHGTWGQLLNGVLG